MANIHLSPGVMRNASIQRRVGDSLAKHLAAANLLGRIQIVRHAHRKTGRRLEISGLSRRGAWHHGSRLTHFDESDDEFTVGFDTGLSGEDIAAYVRGLTPVTKEVFDGLTAQYRQDAFTLAGVSDLRLIQKVRDELATIAEQGGTEAEFETAVNQMISEAGVQQINAFTLDTAFQTAMQKAYSLGRYDQMRDPATMAVLPIWQYWTVGDGRVRPEHRVLHGFAARAEDPVWMKIYPPNGFNCRCSVVPILESEAPEGATDPGYARLPMLARLKVPQPGFGKVFAA
jgi:SPP1 gp7 family putative phage head morphogenesis protein